MRLFHKLALAIVLMSLLVMLFPISVAIAADEVYFPDLVLREAIRGAIGGGDITQVKLDLLTNFAYGGSLTPEIQDITGIEHCTSLTQLSLYWNQISDISPLSGLTNLTWLYLTWNQISDISPLAGLTNLTDLNLAKSQIINISPLAGLTNLETLCLDGNQISDISPIAGLTHLTALYLTYNQISDISPLSGLTNLTGLDLGVNQISNLSPLAGLTNLTGLVLHNNQISDISPLAGLTSLTSLDLRVNQIGDISPLAGLTNLTSLYLDGNQISDIGPLVNNPGLSSGDEVYLTNNPLSTTSVNTYIPQLQARGVTVYYDAPTPTPTPTATPTPPTISSIAVENITDTSATITWITDELATSLVNYGNTTALSNTASDGTLVTDHSITLTNLTPATLYYYEVSSTNAEGNTTVDSYGGAYYTFNTSTPTPTPTPTPTLTPTPPPTPTPTPATPTPTPPAEPVGGGGGGGGFCFIATAAYGSSLDSHVDTLRSFRDQYLETNPIGSAFVSLYYKVSPPMAEFIDEHPTLKPIVRAGLMPAVVMSTVAVNTTPMEKIAIASSLAFVCILVFVGLRRKIIRGKF